MSCVNSVEVRSVILMFVGRMYRMVRDPYDGAAYSFSLNVGEHERRKVCKVLTESWLETGSDSVAINSPHDYVSDATAEPIVVEPDIIES